MFTWSIKIVLLDKETYLLQCILYFESRPSPVARGGTTASAEHNSFYNDVYTGIYQVLYTQLAYSHVARIHVQLNTENSREEDILKLIVQRKSPERKI